MAPPYAKGRQSKNAVVQRRIRRKQRQAQRVFLAGKTVWHAKKKPAKGPKPPPTRAAYPCGPKQLALGDSPPGRERPTRTEE